MLNENIKKLVEYGIETGLTPECERIYTTNLLLEMFHEDSYEDLLKHTPKVGAIVKTAEGRGVVEEVNLLTGKLRVKMDKNDNVVVVKKDDIEVIKDSVIRLDRDEIKALKGLEGK